MEMSEPQRTAELAGPPSYLDDAEKSTERAPSAGARKESDGGSTSVRHQDVRDFLSAILRVFAEDDGVGLVLSGPFRMNTNAGGAGCEPDILFITAEHMGRLQTTRLEGPADLVVEIASQDTRARDRGERCKAYEQAGVREYWVIDPDRKTAEFWGLGPDRRFRALPVEESGIFRSTVVPLLWLRAEWLWADPLPLVRSVLIEWGLPRLFAD